MLNEVLQLDINWLTSSANARWALEIMSIWKETGFLPHPGTRRARDHPARRQERGAIDGPGAFRRSLRAIHARPGSCVVTAICRRIMAVLRGMQSFSPQVVLAQWRIRYGGREPVRLRDSSSSPPGWGRASAVAVRHVRRSQLEPWPSSSCRAAKEVTESSAVPPASRLIILSLSPRVGGVDQASLPCAQPTVVLAAFKAARLLLGAGASNGSRRNRQCGHPIKPFEIAPFGTYFFNSTFVGVSVTLLNIITCTAAGYSFEVPLIGPPGRVHRRARDADGAARGAFYVPLQAGVRPRLGG